MKKIKEYIVDETYQCWIRISVALDCYNIEPENRQANSRTDHIQIVKHAHSRKIPVSLGQYSWNGKHPVSTDGGTWYPMACKVLELKHHIIIPMRRKTLLKEQCNRTWIKPML